MSNKLNPLLNHWRPGSIATTCWLQSQGISRVLARKYVASGWLTPIGQAAYARCGDEPGWPGAIEAMQLQLNKAIWVGGLTALRLHGLVHYLPLSQETLTLFGTPATHLPKWFVNFDWGVQLIWQTSDMLNPEKKPSLPGLGIVQHTDQKIQFSLSSQERAALELLFMVPEHLSFELAAEILEGATSLSPRKLQTLMEACQNIRVKRLMLFLGEHHQHTWFHRLNIDRITLGHGKRQIVKNGKLNSKYQITIPTRYHQSGK